MRMRSPSRMRMPARVPCPRMSRPPTTLCLVGLSLAALVLVGSPADAASEQKLVLRAGWNLVALNVQPADPSPVAVFGSLITGGTFDSVWAYDADAQSWLSFPATHGANALSILSPGVGYWIRLRGAASLTIPAAPASLPRSADTLVDGWNLVGFVLDQKVAYERLLHDLPVRQIWTFDPVVKKFRGVVYGATGGAPSPEDFREIEPGRGYWIYSANFTTVGAELATALPPDLDVSPLLPEPTVPGEHQVFSSVTPGDKNYGRKNGDLSDLYYDTAEQQRAVDLEDFTEVKRLTISNKGAGALTYRARIDNPDDSPWLRFRVAGDIPSDDEYLTELTGVVTTETAALDISVDRTGIPGGQRNCGTVVVESNGHLTEFPAEPVRSISVCMTIPPLDGDYKVTAVINTINGKPADTHNPRLALSLYRDRDGLKGVIDATKTLIIPDYCVGGSKPGMSCGTNDECTGGRCEHYVRFTGGVYQPGTNEFSLSGSFEIPVSTTAIPTDNPYQVPLRRDITLQGDRRTHGEGGLGPVDLKGNYFETIRNVLGEPIQMEGTFIATRESPLPSARDVQTNDMGNSMEIPDTSTELVSEIDVTDQLLLSEVDVVVNTLHDRPADLTITVESPKGTRVVLQGCRNGACNFPRQGEVTYDESADPLDSMDAFVGELAVGRWKLHVLDSVAGPTRPGTLVKWGLKLHGTRVNGIGGRVVGVGAGINVVLSGCGQVVSATTDANGRYSFANRIDCLYTVTVVGSGLQRLTQTVSLQGSDATVADISPGSRPADQPITVTLPSDATRRLRSLSLGAGAGLLNKADFGLIQNRRLQYADDAANVDIDRPPFGPNASDEDTDAFLAGLNPGTGTNLFSSNYDANFWANHTIDPPANPAAVRHIYLSMGGSVIGVTGGGGYQMTIGANP